MTIDTLKAAINKLGYKWFYDRPNLIGIRTNINVPDVFNDLLALVYFDKDGKEQMKVYPITTEPGVYYQKKLLNDKGCAVMKPGQYIDCYSLGFHQNKATHKALIETGSITVIRDKDMDGIAGNSGTDDKGYFGCNIHGANNNTTTKTIGPWSAGCQVHAIWSNKEEMVEICDQFRIITKNKFTYTLITEKDLAL